MSNPVKARLRSNNINRNNNSRNINDNTDNSNNIRINNRRFPLLRNTDPRSCRLPTSYRDRQTDMDGPVRRYSLIQDSEERLKLKKGSLAVHHVVTSVLLVYHLS
jgi:hypothetical protein